MQIGLSFNDLTACTGWSARSGAAGSKCTAMNRCESAPDRMATAGSRRSGVWPGTFFGAETLFEFSQTSRKELKEFVRKFPAGEWDVEHELKFPNLDRVASATPKKIVLHVLMHEILYWAQIATMLRLNSLVDQWHDLIVSPAMGGWFSRSRT
jgi:hypothetical protein